MTVDPTSPCIIGVAQRTLHPGGGDSPEPLALWDEVAREAASDAGPPGLLGRLDSLQVVYTQSWQYDDPPARLAERLGVTPRHRLYSGIGGTTPQLLLGQAADAIGSGRSDLALVVGAEALETRRQMKKQGRRPAWSHKDPARKPFPFEAPFHPAEVAHDVFQAWLTFPVFDMARRSHLGVEPDDYRLSLGRLMAPMTDVAAQNPYAWFRRPRTAEELIQPSPANRLVGYPYTKSMVSIMDVDMAAAVIVASHGMADDLGVPQDRRVYLRGWCYGTDVNYLGERDEMWRSPAMAAVSREALDMSGVGLDDVKHLDLYSCFASSINLARDALGMSEGDGRPVTVTGGLPFCGGAGSDYMLHSIATMTEVLREDPGSFGMVSGVGMHMTKHVFGVYSTTPSEVAADRWSGGASVRGELQRGLDRLPTRKIVDTYSGQARIVAYTVAHARDGEAEWGLAVCELESGERCYGRVEDAGLLEDAESRELVGATVELGEAEGNVNLVKSLVNSPVEG